MKKIIIFNIAFMAFILLNQTVMNICNLPSLINTEYLVDSTIYVVEDNHEDDNLSIGNNTDYCLTFNQNLPGSPSPYVITGISPSIWQPPEL